MGILVAREGRLPIGASVDESEELQAQTEAARSCIDISIAVNHGWF
jgi:hypothetical protein